MKYRMVIACLACLAAFGATLPTAIAQNLVANGSFEEVVCAPHPEHPNSLFSAHPWYSPASGTPDLYGDAPAETGCWQVDYTGPIYLDLGEEVLPQEGVRMAGVYVHSGDFACIREYVQVALTEALEPGVKYCVSFHIALSHSSLLGVDGLGAYFTTAPELSSPSPCLPYVTPQVRTPVGIALTSRDWTLIEGEFVAAGGEQYLTLGCFEDPETLTFESVEGYSINEVAYYYLDNVRVEQCESTTHVATAHEKPATAFYLPQMQQLRFGFVFGGWMAVHDASGRRIFEAEGLQPGLHTADLAFLRSGVYFVSVKDGEAIQRVSFVR